MHMNVRTSAIATLLVLFLTSLPVRIVVFGDCPCGCMHECDTPPLQSESDTPHEHSHHHHHDGPNACRCIVHLPYCPTDVTIACPLPTSIDRVRPDVDSLASAAWHFELIRPPRI